MHASNFQSVCCFIFVLLEISTTTEKKKQKTRNEIDEFNALYYTCNEQYSITVDQLVESVPTRLLSAKAIHSAFCSDALHMFVALEICRRNTKTMFSYLFNCWFRNEKCTIRLSISKFRTCRFCKTHFKVERRKKHQKIYEFLK